MESYQRIPDGAIVTSSLDWGSSDSVGIRVTRSTSGEWELLIDSDGGFDSLVSQEREPIQITPMMTILVYFLISPRLEQDYYGWMMSL